MGAAAGTSLDGRVVVVTGAGRGLGRAYALLAAAEGAKVVVNDPGGAPDGGGGDPAPADAVVAEIEAAGGTAVAERSTVATDDGAEHIVQTAYDAFGDLHAVVNNAGIVRPALVDAMGSVEFDDVVAVHLRGTFATTRAAAARWRRAAADGAAAPRAIVNTSSAAGLHGLPGQVNYTAAKAAIAAITKSTALELAPIGVKVNCVVPMARTRLTSEVEQLRDLMTEEMFDPVHLAPLVAYLAAEDCDFTGQVFSLYGEGVGIYSEWAVAHEVHAEGLWDLPGLREAIDRLPRKVEVLTQARAFARGDRARLDRLVSRGGPSRG